MFKPDIHERSVPFRGNAEAAFDLARTTVLSQGFTIATDTHDELTAVGPGMQSNRQSPLVGASRLRLRVVSSTIVCTATLGGVATMKKFVYLFPPALAWRRREAGVRSAVAFAVVLRVEHGGQARHERAARRR